MKRPNFEDSVLWKDVEPWLREDEKAKVKAGLIRACYSAKASDIRLTRTAIERFSSQLILAFTWRYTEEGEPFWLEIYNRRQSGRR